VDCCAAPGNKTTHVAALLHANTAAAAAAAAAGAPVLNGVPRSKHSSKKARSQQAGDSSQQQGLAAAVPQGLADADISGIRVYAFDKDPKRLKRLAANVGRAGAGSIVVPERADFLTIDPLDPKFKQVIGTCGDSVQLGPYLGLCCSDFQE
jgi:putative methyltransferase